METKDIIGAANVELKRKRRSACRSANKGPFYFWVVLRVQAKIREEFNGQPRWCTLLTTAVISSNIGIDNEMKRCIGQSFWNRRICNARIEVVGDICKA